MNNEPVAWAIKVGKDLIEIVDENRDFQELVDFYKLEQWDFEEVSLYTQEQLEEARKLGMQQERALWNLSESTQEIMNTHPEKQLTDEEIRELGRMSRKWQDPYVWLAKRINRPLKDLTNKEIQEVITEHEWYGWTLEQFARAILRKAQEK